MPQQTAGCRVRLCCVRSRLVLTAVLLFAAAVAGALRAYASCVTDAPEASPYAMCNSRVRGFGRFRRRTIFLPDSLPVDEQAGVVGYLLFFGPVAAGIVLLSWWAARPTGGSPLEQNDFADSRAERSAGRVDLETDGASRIEEARVIGQEGVGVDS